MMHAPSSQMLSLTLGETQEVVLSKVTLKKLSEFRLGCLGHQPDTSSKLSKKEILQPGFSRKLVLLHNCHFSENIFPYTESAPPHRISLLIPTLFCRESPFLFSAFLFCITPIIQFVLPLSSYSNDALHMEHLAPVYSPFPRIPPKQIY